jgi:hypothetical protein
MSAFLAAGGTLQDVFQGHEFASAIGLDRIIRTEVHLGVVRELEPPMDHIGLEYAPFLSVPTDDVIFDYVQGFTDGLAPARAEDAESELAQKDDVFPGQGRASVIDWALKDHYTASDISRYREMLRIREVMRDTQSLPLSVDSMTEDWSAKLARDTARRRRKLDNRLEKMVMDALGTSIIAYNDGKIIFSVNFQARLAAPGSVVRQCSSRWEPCGRATWLTRSRTYNSSRSTCTRSMACGSPGRSRVARF